MLQKSNFIISCENEVDFFNKLPPLEDNSLDLTNSISYVSTLGMIEDADDDIAVKVNIDGISNPFLLSRDQCGGCVAFTNLWMELNEEFDTFEQMETNDDVDEEELEEKRLELISQTQQFIDDLFLNKSQKESEEIQKENAILVLSVKRETKSEE